MRPYDGQAELLYDIVQALTDPTIDSEALGRICLVLDRLIDSGLITLDQAQRLTHHLNQECPV